MGVDSADDKEMEMEELYDIKEEIGRLVSFFPYFILCYNHAYRSNFCAPTTKSL